MPSNQEILILPSTDLILNAKMHSHNCNGKEQNVNPQDILQNYAKKWQIPITSEAFARRLDENDPLNHVRDEFYYPKVGTLPKSKYMCEKFSNIKFYLYISS